MWPWQEDNMCEQKKKKSKQEADEFTASSCLSYFGRKWERRTKFSWIMLLIETGSLALMCLGWMQHHTDFWGSGSAADSLPSEFSWRRRKALAPPFPGPPPPPAAACLSCRASGCFKALGEEFIRGWQVAYDISFQLHERTWTPWDGILVPLRVPSPYAKQ